MGQITSYSEMTAAPAIDDLLFIADQSNSFQMMKIETATLHSAPVFKGGAVGGDLSLADGDGDVGLTLEDGGNIGIGNTSPASKVDIKTTVSPTDASQSLLRLYATDTNSYPYMEFRNDAQRFKIYGAHGGLADAFTIYDQTNTANRLTILTDGKVGISNSAPTSMVHIGDGSGNPSLRLEGSSYDVYLYSDGTNGPGIVSGDVMHIMRNVSSATRKTFFYYDNGGTYTSPLVVLANGATRRVGIGVHAPLTDLHIEGTGNMLQLNSTSGNSSFKLTNGTAGSELLPCFFVNASGFLTIKDTSATVNQAAGIVVEKNRGWINIGSAWSNSTTPTFTYPLAIGDLDNVASSGTRTAKPTAAYFSSDGSVGARIAIVATGSTSASTGVVFANSDSINWLAGSFEDTSVEYFGITKIGAVTDPDSAIFNTTLESNTAYINGSTGGLSATNTAAAFVRALGHASGTMDITGAQSYNVASVTGTSGGLLTLVFSKSLSNTNYIAVVSGYDTVGKTAVTGFCVEDGAQVAGGCTVQLAGSAIDATKATLKLTVAIYGAKLKA